MENSHTLSVYMVRWSVDGGLEWHNQLFDAFDPAQQYPDSIVSDDTRGGPYEPALQTQIVEFLYARIVES